MYKCVCVSMYRLSCAVGGVLRTGGVHCHLAVLALQTLLHYACKQKQHLYVFKRNILVTTFLAILVLIFVFFCFGFIFQMSLQVVRETMTYRTNAVGGFGFGKLDPNVLQRANENTNK